MDKWKLEIIVKKEDLNMDRKIVFEEKIIDLIRKKLEEHHDMKLSDYNQYQIIELWVNKSLK